MRNYSEAEIRDVVVIGHGGSGKTSLGEAILFDAKLVTRLGRVDDETSNLDSEPRRKSAKAPSIRTSQRSSGKRQAQPDRYVGAGRFCRRYDDCDWGCGFGALCGVGVGRRAGLHRKTWEEARAAHAAG